MTNTPTRFSELLDDALHGAKMRQDQLALRLGELESMMLSSSAISMWRKRGAPPEAWQGHLVTVFGEDSALGQALLAGEFLPSAPQPAWMTQPPAQAPTAPQPDRREPAHVPSLDGLYVARWLDKIQDQEVKERIAHQCVALILRVLDGPAPAPTPAPGVATETPVARPQDH